LVRWFNRTLIELKDLKDYQPPVDKGRCSPLV